MDWTTILTDVIGALGIVLAYLKANSASKQATAAKAAARNQTPRQ